MPNVDFYPHGAPVWADLATPDQRGAKRFYTRLFGWEFEDLLPSGSDEAHVYTMYKLRGRFTGAATKSTPPSWQVYISVENADATVTRARKAGAKVLAEPFDIMGEGRMAVLEDPQGSNFKLWQANRHRGAGVMNEPGAPSWYELGARDKDSALSFYKYVFQCGSVENACNGVLYIMLTVEGKPRAGIFQSKEDKDGGTPSWTVYFGVADIEASLSVISAEGGSVLTDGPVEIDDEYYAIIRDPQGASFGVVQKKKWSDISGD